MKCAQCQHENPIGAIECEYCGYKLNQVYSKKKEKRPEAKSHVWLDRIYFWSFIICTTLAILILVLSLLQCGGHIEVALILFTTYSSVSIIPIGLISGIIILKLKYPNSVIIDRLFIWFIAIIVLIVYALIRSIFK